MKFNHIYVINTQLFNLNSSPLHERLWRDKEVIQMGLGVNTSFSIKPSHNHHTSTKALRQLRDIREFYRFVFANNLKAQAIKLIDSHLQSKISTKVKG